MVVPVAPATVAIERVSGTQFALAWSAVAGASSYGLAVRRGSSSSVQVVARGLKGTSFTSGRFTGEAAVRLGIFGINRDGDGPIKWAGPGYSGSVAYMYLPSAKPVNLRAAVRPADGTVTLTWKPTSYYKRGFEVETTRNGVTTVVRVGDGVTGLAADSWTGPLAGGVTEYRVRMFAGEPDTQFYAGGFWSDPLTVTGDFTAPKTPVVTVSNVAAGTAPRVHASFEATDFTEQTGVEVQYRSGSGSWVTVAGTTQTALDLPSGLAAGVWDVRARMKAGGPEWSDWSPVTVFRVVTRPVVTVTSPVNPFTGGLAFVVWTVAQAEGVPQSAWQVVLKRGATVLAQASGVGPTSTVVFDDQPLTNSTSYTVEVVVTAAGVDSVVASKAFTTAFIPPAAPGVTAVWNDVVGGHEVSVSSPVLRPLFEVSISGSTVVFDDTPVGFG